MNRGWLVVTYLGTRQACRGSVMLWAVSCWETLGPDIHVHVTLTSPT